MAGHSHRRRLDPAGAWGWGKVVRGPSAYVRPFMEQGFDPALPWIWAALIIEFVGGIALILGLFTRFFAAAAAIELLIITALYWQNGFSWLNRGYEYTLLWGLLCFAIALRGGGRTRSIARSASSSSVRVGALPAADRLPTGIRQRNRLSPETTERAS